MRIPKNLKDINLGDVPRGTLFYPSRSTLRSGRDGNYYREDRGEFVRDRDTFPAVALDTEAGNPLHRRVLTPKGIVTMSINCLVSAQVGK